MATENNVKSYLNKYTFIIGCMGLSSSLIHNGLMRRPVISGVHKHLLFTVFGAALGSFLGNIESQRYGRRDFYVADYIERHPEDFPAAPKKKVGETYGIWVPSQ